MRVLIDIPEQDYELACNYPEVLFGGYAQFIKKGTIIPDNATNGDIIKAMFPNANLGTLAQDDIIVNRNYSNNDDIQVSIPIKWWNAPYKKSEG